MFPSADKIIAAAVMFAHSETLGRTGLHAPTAPPAVARTPFQAKTVDGNQLTVYGTTFAFPLGN
jgi:hypothetical protein